MARKYIAKEVKEIKEQYNYDFSILLNQNSQKNIESIAARYWMNASLWNAMVSTKLSRKTSAEKE